MDDATQELIARWRLGAAAVAARVAALPYDTPPALTYPDRLGQAWSGVGDETEGSDERQ